MKRLILAVVSLSFFAFVTYQQYSTEAQTFEDAYYAWDAGDYIKALTGLKQVLESPGGDNYLEDIALLTGELYHVEEVSVDGSAVRFSPKGKFAAYERRKERTTATHIVNIQNGIEEVAEIDAQNVVFSPAADQIAYLEVKETDELKKARSEAAQQTGRRVDPNISWLEAKNSQIVVHDLSTENKQRLDTGDLVVINLAYSVYGSKIYFTAGVPGDTSKSDIYAISESSGTPEKITSGSGFKTNPSPVSGGRYLIFNIVTRNPIPQPPGGQPQPQAAAFGRQRARGGAGPGRFAVQNLSTGDVKTFEGSSYALAADGSALTFTSSTQEGAVINTVSLSGGMNPVEVYETTERIGTPQISPDGAHVTFQMMTKDDYEVYVIKSDGTGELKRISREIQHDRYPVFITNELVLSAKGEGRHQRSYIYDINTGETVKLFHNNTVRTIAPEYEWAASRDGSKLLIVSERDGDTITPERGVYLLDFNRKVAKAELLERIETNLASEIDLHKRGEKMYRPIFDAVKSITEQISTARIFEYEKALYDFDSKNISQPGNEPAREYIFNVFKSFGYEPENQWFEARGGVRTANVLATLRGTENPELVYVLSSHYDSNTRSPGADDNTSSVVTLLEAARVLKNHPMPATIVFAAFTGEESGLLGSREYVRQAVENNVKLVGALNNDMVGWAENHRLDNTIRYSNKGICDLQHAAAFLFSKLITYDAHYYKSTDAAAYYQEYGDIVGGIGSYPVLGSPYYHQVTDRLETVNHQLITEVSKTTTASLMLLASSPSRLTGLEVVNRSGDTAEISWTPSPEKYIKHYIVAYGSPDEPMKNTMKVKEPKAALSGVEKGTVVAVKAVNSRNLEGWDWARITIEK